MPGSIQVSVLDFKELPSSSNCVKFSLGKVEHEAGEKETFSFPLSNLRDNLMIIVQDAEGNQVSQTGVRTVSIIEKGTWDDVFPIEGGGLIHMKLQFLLSEDERNRIRLMRESAMKKKQAEILGSRHVVSDVLSSSSSQDLQKSGLNGDSLLNAYGAKEESFPRQPSLTNVIDTREETSSSHLTQETEQKSRSPNNVVETLDGETKGKIPNDVKETNEESTNTRDNVKNNNAVKSQPLYDRVKKLDDLFLEDKNPSFVKKTSSKSKFPLFTKETEVNTIKNTEIQLQKTDLLKTLQDSSSTDVGSSRSTVAEKMKSFSPKLAGEMEKRCSLEKTPQNIKKMISVFESTISQDRVPLKPVSEKTYRFGTSRLLKDYYEKSSSLKNSEDSSSSRLRNSFSTGDLRKNLSNIITEGDQVDVDNNFVEPSENMQSRGNDPKGAEKMAKGVVDEEESLPKSPHESPRSADAEASNRSFGQAMKIALVVGFGVLVFLFRQKEPGKGKKKENIRSLRNQVLMNKRGSIEEQGRRFSVSRLS